MSLNSCSVIKREQQKTATIRRQKSTSIYLFKAHSHGAIFSQCDCVFFTSHGMDCMDVSDTVHTVRLRFD